MVNIGFTGTRYGLNTMQINKIKDLLCNAIKDCNYVEVHHGDCKGADSDFHNICESIGNIHIVVHPPDNDIMRAFCNSKEIKDKKPYLERNKNIVDISDILIACPIDNNEILRSGTWSTIRYAKKNNVHTIIIPKTITNNIEYEYIV
jgi:hypothetical protein